MGLGIIVLGKISQTQKNKYRVHNLDFFFFFNFRDMKVEGDCFLGGETRGKEDDGEVNMIEGHNIHL
jgi:hypothetical protein